MDSRNAFLKAVSTLVAGFAQLAHYRIAGNIAIMCILDVNALDRERYKCVDLAAVQNLKTVRVQEYKDFASIFQESSMVLAFSWLESFLAEVEEALYLKNPANLGEQVEVKLGKILHAASIEGLLHDIIRRRIRDRSQWSVANRLKDLQEHHSFTFAASQEDMEWISETRNDIIHCRRSGRFQVKGKRVTYESVQRQAPIGQDEVDRFLHIVANAVVDLYAGACRALTITARFPVHRQTLRLIDVWRTLWPLKASPSKQSVERAPPSGGG